MQGIQEHYASCSQDDDKGNKIQDYFQNTDTRTNINLQQGKIFTVFNIQLPKQTKFLFIHFILLFLRKLNAIMRETRKYKQLLKNRLAQLQLPFHGMEPEHRNSGGGRWEGRQAGHICPKLLQDPAPDVPASLLFGIPELHTGDKKSPLLAIVCL